MTKVYDNDVPETLLLQEVGEVSHLAGSGRVLVRLDRQVREGQVLCDEKSVKVARVVEMIGPVDRPYASAMPLTNSIKKFAGKRVFAPESPPASKKKKFRRNRR